MKSTLKISAGHQINIYACISVLTLNGHFVIKGLWSKLRLYLAKSMKPGNMRKKLDHKIHFYTIF